MTAQPTAVPDPPELAAFSVKDLTLNEIQELRGAIGLERGEELDAAGGFLLGQGVLWMRDRRKEPELTFHEVGDRYTVADLEEATAPLVEAEPKPSGDGIAP